MTSRPKRCLNCFYVLDGLPAQRCPECGRAFDPGDLSTFTYKLPFVRWRFWMPAVLLTGGCGLVLYVLLGAWVGYGWATTLVLPFCLGATLGYLAKFGPAVGIGAAILFVVAMMIGLVTLNATGLFCALVLGAMAIVPITMGVIVGTILRWQLKLNNFDQRDYLPVWLILSVPVIWAAVEGRPQGLPLVDVLTTQIVDAPPAAAWDAIQFYEDVRHEPPWLLRLPIWRPVYATGHSRAVGDVKTCVYTKGRLVKRVTRVEHARRLDFEVLVQEKIESEAVRLTGGSFILEPLDDGRRTRVTLVTRYEPLLAPRFAWGPFERYAVHTLHGHVLRGMRDEAVHPDERLRKVRAIREAQ
jgi:hypothetical protein